MVKVTSIVDNKEIGTFNSLRQAINYLLNLGVSQEDLQLYRFKIIK